VPRPSLRTLFVAACLVVATVQLSAVTLAALPTNRYSSAAAPHTTWLSPFFTQNWRLFAPNPVSEDRSVAFQGSYVDAEGRTRQTPWVDWTEVELDLVHHRLVGGRAGYVTNKLASPLVQRHERLTDEQQDVAASTTEEAPPSWSALRDALLEPADTPESVALFLRYERAVTRLASDVLTARWPDVDLAAVRYAMRRQAVVPYADRHATGARRDAVRPLESERIGGWRVPDPGDAAERRVVADFDRRHR
jgi:hypothetical protein